MKICSVCGHQHNNSELRCSSCAEKNLRPSDTYRDFVKEGEKFNQKRRNLINKGIDIENMSYELKAKYSDVVEFNNPLVDSIDLEEE